MLITVEASGRGERPNRRAGSSSGNAIRSRFNIRERRCRIAVLITILPISQLITSAATMRRRAS
eukprot:164109-Pleurochrysis_carterae.AAC.1